jgi:chromosomal replication initiator protein
MSNTRATHEQYMSDLWISCKSALEQSIPPQHFKTWVKPLVGEVHGQTLLINAPNVQVLRWAKANLSEAIDSFMMNDAPSGFNYQFGLLESADTRVHADEAPVEIQETAPSAVRDLRVKQPLARPLLRQSSTQEVDSSIPAHKSDIKLKPEFQFASFVAGKANQLAFAAAQQVSLNPGASYNPLFIYGGTGLGKTHLLHAIGLEMLSKNPRAKVRYIHTEQFVSDVVSAYQNKSFDALKNQYRTLDLLLIDDIQFFVGKTRSQEEFFYTFNTLFENNKPVVLTSDSYPKEIQGIEERLKSRFGWGLTVAVEPPELEMRVAILIRKAQSLGVSLPEEVAFFIANAVRSNVRELEGALNQVIATARFHEQPISVQSARDALQNHLAVVSRLVSIENIQRTVAEFYKIKVADMYSPKRSRNVARPRQVAMAIAKELTHHSLPEIGDAFNKDHTTVLHACKRIDSLKIDDPQVARDYQQLVQALTR